MYIVSNSVTLKMAENEHPTFVADGQLSSRSILLHACLFLNIGLELIMPFGIILQAMGIETESRAQPQKEHVTLSAAAAQPLPGFTSHVCQSTFKHQEA